MSQSLIQVYLHLVFSTKSRQPFLRNSKIRDRTHAYLATTCHNLGAPSLIVGGAEDHVHLLCRMSKVLTIANLIKELKRESSKWVKNQDDELRDFYWQAGYGAFSISPGHVDAIMEYIDQQGEHHRQETFQDEFRRLCKKYGIAIDERYVWD